MGYESIILASASARRGLLLDQIGVRHEPRAMDVDERPRPGEPPDAYVMRIARDKAAAAVRALRTGDQRPVLAADTTVALGSRIFGKPADEADGVAMLQALAGQSHEVLTAVVLVHAGTEHTALNRSQVRFRALSVDECRRYWATGEAAGKAGGYAIQGRAAVFIESLEGSFSGVMGLPLFETAALLDAAGVCRWQPDA